MIIIIKGTQCSYHHKKKVIKSLGHFRPDASCNKNTTHITDDMPVDQTWTLTFCGSTGMSWQTERECDWLSSQVSRPAGTVWYGLRDNIQLALWSPLAPTGTRILWADRTEHARPQLCPHLSTCWTPNHKASQPAASVLCPPPPSPFI